MKEVIDVLFPVIGPDLIPIDHNYHLFGAFSSLVKEMHSSNLQFALIPVQGVKLAPKTKWNASSIGMLKLTDNSVCGVRIKISDIYKILPLGGSTIVLGHHRLRLGLPVLKTPTLSSAMSSSFVTYKMDMRQEPILQKESLVQHMMDELSKITSQPIDSIGGEIKAVRSLTFGKPRQRLRSNAMVVSGDLVVGFEVELSELTEETAAALIVHGLGGKRHMGGGVFKAVKD